MASQAQAHSDTDRLFPQAGSQRCPLCDQPLPDHLTAEDLQARLLEREAKGAKAQEARIRADVEKELGPKTAKAVEEALADQRQTLDKAKDDEVNRAKAEEFEKNQKLEKTVNELRRQLAQKTSNELGEGAELDLYQELRNAFEDDRIKRIPKGEPGADIRHEVFHNGEPVGKILYDSKNHRAWRSSFVEKLKKDQLADEADHAILSTSVFPAGQRQLVLLDGVLVANPARVVELVKLLREHLVRTHRLRLSADERDDKKTVLYEFIVSERYGQLINRFDSLTKDLLDLDVSEKRAHETVWRKRGGFLKETEKAHADLAREIDRIVAGDLP
ncbi:MAG: DUF2130 domain-containing protein [Gammaproteobacteria bacterium]|nr:DUF2130 domain-containing protein [Gammaproteobacteria bacterium]